MTSAALNKFGDRFMDLLPKLMHEFNSHESKYITSGEITPLQLTVLDCLSRNNQCEMCCISKALNISFSTATGMMDRLVKNGCVSREHSQEDRRKVIVTITAKASDHERDQPAQARGIDQNVQQHFRCRACPLSRNSRKNRQ